MGFVATEIGQQRQSRKEQKKARRIEERRARIAAGRSAVENIRQAQIARAEIIAAGEVAGVSGSSAVLGGAGAVQSQAAGNVAFAQQMHQLQALAMQRMEKAQDFAFRSQALGQIRSSLQAGAGGFSMPSGSQGG